MPINFLAVLVSGIAFMIIGSLWYGPLFGNLWMKGMGWDPKDTAFKNKMKKKAGPAYAQMFVGALLTSYVLAVVFWAFGVAAPEMTPMSAALNGAVWTWLGFYLPVIYGKKLWEGKKFKYVAVDLGYYLVVLLVAGFIIAYWK